MSLILSQKVIIKPNKLKKYYIEKGYIVNNSNSLIEINVKDLYENSNVDVLCECDHCKKKFYRKRKIIKDINDTYCNDCTPYKIKQTFLNKYGTENPFQTNIFKEKVKQTNLQKYGVEYYSQTNECKEKVKQTNLQKYGVEYAWQSNEIKEKRQKTMLEKFGVEHPLQSNEIKKHREETCIKKYNVKNTFNLEKSKESRKQTCLKKYGVEYAINSKKSQEKSKQVIMKKYGVKNISQNKEIRDKARNTMIKRYGIPNLYCKIPCSKQQLHIGILLNGVINKYIKNYGYADILLENEKIIIEYDGGGHNYKVKVGQQTQEEFNNNEKEKEKNCIKLGYKLIRLISIKDTLPLDNEIIKLIDDAKSNFNTYKIIRINIDTNNISYE